MSQFDESRRGLINWFEAGLELCSIFSLSESLKSYLIMSEFIILAGVNLDNIHSWGDVWSEIHILHIHGFTGYNS